MPNKYKRGGDPASKSTLKNISTKEGQITNKPSRFWTYFIGFSLLFVLICAVYIYMNYDYDYILCRINGSGDEFCNAKTDTIDNNEERARRRSSAR